MKNESFRQRVCVILGICMAAVITGAVFFHRAEAVAAETLKEEKAAMRINYFDNDEMIKEQMAKYSK